MSEVWQYQVPDDGASTKAQRSFSVCSLLTTAGLSAREIEARAGVTQPTFRVADHARIPFGPWLPSGTGWRDTATKRTSRELGL